MPPTRKPPKSPLDHEPQAVKYARDNAGLTQQQLAEMCGVSRPLITEIEMGTRNATPRMIGLLAKALNCPRVVLERKREPETEAATARRLPESGVRGDERAHEQALPEMRDDAVARSA